MSDKFTVLFVKDTGNVIGVLTRAADPEEKLAADLLAGEAFVLRYVGDPAAAGYGQREFLIEPDQLDVAIPDLDPAAIAAPLEFSVDGNKNLVPANSAGTVTPDLSSTSQVKITFNPKVTSESKVWVQIVGPDPDERQVVTGKIPANGTTVTINLRPLVTGRNYDLLTLVQGYTARFVRDAP